MLPVGTLVTRVTEGKNVERIKVEKLEIGDRYAWKGEQYEVSAPKGADTGSKPAELVHRRVV